MDKLIIIIQRSVRLGNHKPVFRICRQVFHFTGNEWDERDFVDLCLLDRLDRFGSESLPALNNHRPFYRMGDSIARQPAFQAIVISIQDFYNSSVRCFDKSIFVTRAKDASRPIKPIFGPSGVSIGHIRP